MSKKDLSRREFLRMSVLASGALALSACTPAPQSSPATPAPEATKGAAPAAPAAAAPTKAPAAATAAAADDAKIGKHLIGKLEGPEIIVDPAKWPKAFKEAPQLAELVKAGKLPPVAERVPAEPLVVKPVHEIGKYGGVWRRGHSGPADMWNGLRAVSGPDQLLFWDYTGNKIVPNLAKGLEMTDGGKTALIHLRKGAKWSDGHALTADDFVFWFQDIYSDKALVPGGTSVMSINGKPGRVEKVDDLTVAFKFDDPYYMFPTVVAGGTALAGHSHRGVEFFGAYAPAHYLKQFLPKYSSEDELNKKAKEAKFDSWKAFLKFKNDWALNPELPVMTPWKTTTPINNNQWIVERNPYSIWVDTEGNQLPYIDKVVFSVGENLEIINLRAAAGEYDMQARHLDIQKLPVLLENQKKGNYKVSLDVGGFGSDMLIKVNQTYEADPEIGKLLATTDFRRALSLGIDRDQINEVFWLGTGTPSSTAPIESNLFSPGPEYRTLWATYDPKKANEMLDKLGLDKKDAQGYRLRTDGKGRLRLEIMCAAAQFINFAAICEMIKEQYKKIGIELDVKEVERSLCFTKSAANEQQLSCWNNDGSEHLYTHPFHIFAFDNNTPANSGTHYAAWFQSNGKMGKAPTGRLLEMYQMFNKAFGVPEDEQIRLGKEIWKIVVDEVINIGVVGLAAAAAGVRIHKNNMGNVPSRQVNSPDVKTPTISRPVTFYWKS